MQPKEYFEELWKTILSGRTWKGEFCNKKKDGTIYWEHASISPVKDGEGRTTHFVAVKEDITEQRAARERFRILFESSVDGLILWDHEGIADCNEAAVNMLRAGSKNDLLGHHPREFSPEFQPDGQLSLEKGRAVSAMALETGGCRFDWVHKKLDGEEFPVEVNLTPIKLDGRQMFLVAWHDLTERKQAEDMLRESESRFRLLFDGSSDAHMLMDGPQIIDCNERAVQLLRADSKQDLLSRHPAEFSPRFQPDGVLSVEKGEVMRLKALEKGWCRFDWMHQKLDGEQFPVEVGLTSIHMGARILLLVVWHDLTERNQIMQELERARDEADAANRAKSTFLATMSHEIRTPMNGVLGTVDVLRQTPLSPEQADLAGIIHDSAHSLLTIINDILDFSKIESGKMELDYVPIAIEEVVASACSALSPVAQEKGVALNFYADPKLPGRIMSDPVRLRQIVNNLLGNAIKFTAGQSRPAEVKVRVLRDNEKQLRLVVSDNGIGMKAEDSAGLFAPFKQADSSITRRFGGTGLGLSICKNFVEMLGGSISVESQYGEGSVFTVILPVHSGEDGPVPAELPRLQGVDGVILGPDPDTVSDWHTYLAHAGASMAEAANIDEAARLVRGQSSPASIMVIDCTHGKPRPVGMQEVFGDCPGKIHCVIVETGGRRSVRREGESVIVLCSDVTYRETLIHAVALAAGRVAPERLEETDENADRVIAPSMEEAKAQGRLILVAEDNEINQKVIRYQLASMGFACNIASNGQEALVLWRSGDYALLITDLHMPVMDGYSLAMTIRREEGGHAHIPIIAFTASISRDELGKCTAAGMDGHLTKPAPMDKFKSILNEWLPPAKARNTAQPSTNEETPMETSLPVLDTRVLEGIVGSDPATIAEFLDDYLGSLGNAAAEIRASLAENDLKRTGALGHRLKSSSRSVGAMRLGGCCEKLERAGKTDDEKALSLLAPEFEQDVSDTISAIVNLKEGQE
jgi:PAS domain S-box-containing protein